MKKDYVIAIPSYRRASTVKEKTLAFLQKLGVDPSKVTVFVGSEDEEKEYRKVLSDTPFDNIVVGVVGMGAIRNFIQQYYPEDTYILNLDDDLSQIQYRKDEKTLAEITNLDDIAKAGFEACEENGSRLWGIYAASNPFFMKDRIAVGLYYVIGSMWGCINSHREESSVSLDDKEDYERSIKYYIADGSVCRVDYVTVKSKYYAEKGGMQETRTSDRIEKSTKILAEKYPDYCSPYIRKTTGHWELRLKDKSEKSDGASLEDLFG